MRRDRKIGPVLATLLVAGNMIGSGIYLLPATLAAIGSITLLSWLLATVGALSIGATLAYLGRIAPRTGGLCTYASEALGPHVGFQASVLYWTCAWIGNIAIALAAIGYLAHFAPVLAHPQRVALSAVALIWLFTFVNILGPRFACQLQSLSLIVGLIPVIVVATAGWGYFDAGVFTASWNPSGAAPGAILPGSMVAVFWAFVGLESASVGTAVVENPQRNVPLATFAGVSLAALVYVAACAVLMGMLPSAQLATSTAPFADAAALMIGPTFASVIALLAFTKAIGTLCGWVLLTAQVGKAAADKGLFPRWLGRVDRAGIPVRNLLLMAALMSVATFVSVAPSLNAQFNRMIEMSVLLCLATYGLACLSVWHYRHTGGSAHKRYQPAGRGRAAVLRHGDALQRCAYVVVGRCARGLELDRIRDCVQRPRRRACRELAYVVSRCSRFHPPPSGLC